MIYPKNDKHEKSYESGKYKKELQLYKNILSKSNNAVFFDVGANVGYFSVKLQEYCSEIHCFEPVTQIFDCLKENTRHLENIKINKKAIGLKNEQVIINISTKHSQGSTIDSRTRDKFNHIFTNEKEEISVITLKNYMTTNQIQKINLLKLDVEGYESQAIIGLEEMIARVDCIIYESYYKKDIEAIIKHTSRYGFVNKPLPLNSGGPMYILEKKYE